jgi:cation diffusion facilitator CzcD-associated flavoprotein CzcO
VRVAIIGAGAAGLSTAKVLIQAGHDIQVFDKTPDVGGVWSSTRRYPGVTTQSPKAQYSFSDFPMPKAYPEWPTGAQVQAYFAASDEPQPPPPLTPGTTGSPGVDRAALQDPVG